MRFFSLYYSRYRIRAKKPKFVLSSEYSSIVTLRGLVVLRNSFPHHEMRADRQTACTFHGCPGQRTTVPPRWVCGRTLSLHTRQGPVRNA